MRATTSLRGTSPGDGASTTLSGGGICVLKSYTNNAKKIKSPFSNYSMSCMSEFKISNLKKLRPVLDHKTYKSKLLHSLFTLHVHQIRAHLSFMAHRSNLVKHEQNQDSTVHLGLFKKTDGYL